MITSDLNVYIMHAVYHGKYFLPHFWLKVKDQNKIFPTLKRVVYCQQDMETIPETNSAWNNQGGVYILVRLLESSLRDAGIFVLS